MLRRHVPDQLSHPSGPAGRVVAALMHRGNREFNARAIARLDVRPGLRVLDLGVDRAPDVVAAARRRHADEVAAGRLELHEGAVEAPTSSRSAGVDTAPDGATHLITALA